MNTSLPPFTNTGKCFRRRDSLEAFPNAKRARAEYLHITTSVYICNCDMPQFHSRRLLEDRTFVPPFVGWLCLLCALSLQPRLVNAINRFQRIVFRERLLDGHLQLLLLRFGLLLGEFSCRLFFLLLLHLLHQSSGVCLRELKYIGAWWRRSIRRKRATHVTEEVIEHSLLKCRDGLGRPGRKPPTESSFSGCFWRCALGNESQLAKHRRLLLQIGSTRFVQRRESILGKPHQIDHLLHLLDHFD
mmetsp:Transcript_38361/g.63523  ORF Transcript_38361/g.63523 Transcript_38361/m.63523 type:complete len:245 (-) Transcript_38361:595-1329(-)